ncbi:MAG: bifunctional folylpolyglutamate synthase/dihydrofolate synthase, partial [Pseudomonadota bacterium]
DTSLTYFEFGTLAAFDLFARAELDVAVLEVGLGGRLDAVNLLDADVALVTAIDIDHAAWLGGDREAIGREKAGIFRANKPAVCSDPQPPASLLAHAESLATPLLLVGRDFTWSEQESGWCWRSTERTLSGLPLPALRGKFQLQNGAGVVQVLALLETTLPVSPQHLRQGLLSVALPGRFQLFPGEVPLILDVAHNPQSATALAENLRQMPCDGRTLAVAALLEDKDLNGVVAALAPLVDRWYVAGLDVWRGGDGTALIDAVAQQGGTAAPPFDSLTTALAQARAEARPGDRIVAFGSFHTVADVLLARV